MTTRRLLPLLALPALLALGACSDDDGGDQTVDAGGTATSVVDTTDTTGATVTTGSDSSTITTTPGVAGASPEDASQRLYDAWVAGDQGAAAEVGAESALADLFVEQPQELTMTGCRQSETVADATECDFNRGEDLALTFLVEGNGEDGYRVTQVGFL